MLAYGVREYQVAGPPWLSENRYLIDARMPPGTDRGTTLLMLRNLLALRFGVVVHNEQRRLPVFFLEVAADGPRLKKVNDAEASSRSVSRSITSTGISMNSLANRLSKPLGFPVIDKTGLDGFYEVSLTWDPPEANEPGMDEIMRAVRAQLGLVLKSDKNETPVLVVDKAMKVPTEN